MGCDYKKSLKRCSWVDASRVLAMLVVVLYHLPSSAMPAVEPGSLAQFVLRVFNGPGVSLALFFVLAGYFTGYKFELNKWLVRLLSLFVPYVIWNLFCTFGLTDEITFSRIFGVGSEEGLCADYPLWFIRDVFFITLLQPLWRYFPCTFFIFCIGCLCVLGDNAPSVFLENIPIPEFYVFCLFMGGVLLSRITLQTLQSYSNIWFPCSILLAVISFFLWSHAPILYNIFGACVILGFFSIIEKICFPITLFLSKMSHACFLTYASHAGMIIVIGKLLQKNDLCDNLCAVYIPLAVAIYAVNVGAYYAIKRFLPVLLPFVAHEGKLLNLNRK
ncbi:MAG: acyltransferase family protein [Akkermansia sp.]|nr:acyltransferase family protein [Akkermansia sp.]